MLDDTPLHLRPDFLLDVRVRERHVVTAALTTAQVKEYLETLPDCAENAEYVDLPEIESNEHAPSVTRVARDVDDAQEELLTEEKI